MKGERLELRIDKETLKKLRLVAKKDGRPVSNYVRFLIEKAIKSNVK
jgi:predicted DNA-binding protein